MSSTFDRTDAFLGGILVGASLLIGLTAFYTSAANDERLRIAEKCDIYSLVIINNRKFECKEINK